MAYNSDAMSFRGGPHDGSHQPGPIGQLLVPLFPLPNVVLFPKAVLPLHIFEERYKEMTRDVLAGERQIAMALLQPGWEKDYYCRPAIDSIVCVGQVLTHEKLPDGRYNFLLQGKMRARVIRELSIERDGERADKPYRIAALQPLEERSADPDAVEAGRSAVAGAFAESPLAGTPLGEKFLQLLHTDAPAGDLVDLMAFNFIEDVGTKQKLLGESDVIRRLAMMLEALASLRTPMEMAMQSRRMSKPSLN